MIDTLSQSSMVTAALPVACGLVVGAVLGFIHFGLLRWNAGLLLGGDLGKAIALQLLRFALLAVVLDETAKFGAPALLSAALGVLTARNIVLRKARMAS